MTEYEGLTLANADEECRIWIRQLIDMSDEVAAFVDARLDSKGTGEYHGFSKGSSNRSFHMEFGVQRTGVLIRFAKPGHTHSTWRTKKVANEVCVIQHLRQRTTVPLPGTRC